VAENTETGFATPAGILVAEADALRRQAAADAHRIRQEARLEAGRVLAAAEAQAARMRIEARLAGGGRRAEIERLKARVDHLAGAVDEVLDCMQAVLVSVAGLAAPAGSVPAGPEPEPAREQLVAPSPPGGLE
jgi:hypothetical protein